MVLPFITDQGLNSKLLVEIERAKDGSFNRNDIAKALRMAMVWDLRANAKNVVAVFEDRKLH